MPQWRYSTSSSGVAAGHFVAHDYLRSPWELVSSKTNSFPECVSRYSNGMEPGTWKDSEYCTFPQGDIPRPILNFTLVHGLAASYKCFYYYLCLSSAGHQPHHPSYCLPIPGKHKAPTSIYFFVSNPPIAHLHQHKCYDTSCI